MTASGLARIRASAAQLMDPSTRPREARGDRRRDPAILWIAGNVHGGEESGTDASLRVLWELADRSDCAATQILDNAIVVILPIQNPDGREADTRRNAYGFDMNRDWFARTQPETDGKLELLRRYPPVLFIDAHEMGDRDGYFFPPNADPIYHETTDAGGRAGSTTSTARRCSDEFDARGIPYFNYDIYDLFYQGYGDTVPTTGFGAAGMTFEKTSSHPTPRRVLRAVPHAVDVALDGRGATSARSSTGWHDAWVEARRQGRAGRARAQRGGAAGATRSSSRCPTSRVRHYFLRADDPAKAREVQALVRRLQRMDVRVRRLTRDADGRATTRPTAAPRARSRCPPGTLRGDDGPAPEALGPGDAQRGHVHAVPVLLRRHGVEPAAAVQRGRRLLRPAAARELRTGAGRRAGRSGRPARPRRRRGSRCTRCRRSSRAGIESAGWLRYLLDRWGLAYREVTAEEIKAGALRRRRGAARAGRLRDG